MDRIVCLSKSFFVEIPRNNSSGEECSCTCYEDFSLALGFSQNMTPEIFNCLKKRFLSYHHCCDNHTYLIDLMNC